MLNAVPDGTARQTRNRPSLYEEAARTALIVLWEASDRVCAKRLKALVPILLPALERHGHLRLDEPIRSKVLAMSAATIDRSLLAPRNATRQRTVRSRGIHASRSVTAPMLLPKACANLGRFCATDSEHAQEAVAGLARAS